MIRNLEQKDKVPMNAGVLDTLWEWIHDESHDVNGFCFELEGKIVGFAHYKTMPRPIKGEYIGFLIAQKLISHLKSISKENNWDGIRWITHSSNENAKKLYDKIANNKGFELYELKRD